MKNHDFSIFFALPKIFLGVAWGIGVMRTRAGQLLEASYVGCAALKGLQGVRRCARGGAGRVDSAVPNPKNHEK